MNKEDIKKVLENNNDYSWSMPNSAIAKIFNSGHGTWTKNMKYDWTKEYYTLNFVVSLIRVHINGKVRVVVGFEGGRTYWKNIPYSIVMSEII
jgi:hypothetical protein